MDEAKALAKAVAGVGQLELDPGLPQSAVEPKSYLKPALDLTAVAHDCFAGDLLVVDPDGNFCPRWDGDGHSHQHPVDRKVYARCRSRVLHVPRISPGQFHPGCERKAFMLPLVRNTDCWRWDSRDD